MRADGDAVREILGVYRRAWGFALPLTLLHLSVRLIVSLVLIPFVFLVLGLGLYWSATPSLTDQEIARFLLTPVGALTALCVAATLFVASALDVALVMAALRRPEARGLAMLRVAWLLTVPRLPAIFGFAVQLVVRILALMLPFLLAAGLVAWMLLTEHDINYYLTYQPPAFLTAALLIGLIILAMAGLLLWVLSGWALALRLRTAGVATTTGAFSQSAALLQGHRVRVMVLLSGWIGLRAAVGALIAMVMSALTVFLQSTQLPDLSRVVVVTLFALGIWSLFNSVLAGVSNGALAVLLNRLQAAVSPVALPIPDPVLPGAFSRPMMAGLITIGLAGAFMAIGALSLKDEITHRLGPPTDVEIIAHRGAAGARPENTLAAVEKAIEDGADWIEIDVQETAEGEVIVTHDSDFMKQAGVPTKVWEITRAELDRIDIGNWFDAAYADQRVPGLREVLALVRGQGRLIIELKYYGHDDRLEERVAQLVEEAGMIEDIMIMSLKREGVAKMRALRPDWPVGILAARAVGDISKSDAEFLAVNTGQVSLDLVQRAHAAGQKLYVWTVDDPRSMSRMISMGVDGLITNEPALAREVMREMATLGTGERLLLWLTDRFRLQNLDLSAEPSEA